MNTVYPTIANSEHGGEEREILVWCLPESVSSA